MCLWKLHRFLFDSTSVRDWIHAFTIFCNTLCLDEATKMSHGVEEMSDFDGIPSRRKPTRVQPIVIAPTETSTGHEAKEAPSLQTKPK